VSERDRPSGDRAPSVRVQRRLAVGAANDPAEREADLLADRVVQALLIGGSAEPCRLAASTPRIARRTTGADGFEVDRDTQRGIESARGAGQALPTKIRRSMEGAFGADFSGVRLHVGEQSDALNERVQAKAFTLGNDVFVRRSDYAPGTSAGQHLLAHELAHTVQQGASRVQRRGLAGDVTTTGPATAQRVIQRETALQIVQSVRGELDTTRQLTSSNWYNPAKFKEATNTRGHMRGASLKAIDTYLVQYAPIANDPGKNDERLKLLVQMQYAAEQWILDHSAHDDDGNRGALKKDRKTGAVENESKAWLIDPKRKGRFAGMAYFLENVSIAVTNTKGLLANTETDEQTLGKVEQSGASDSHKKLKAKYDGDPTSVLTRLGALVEMAVPNEGDASEIEVAFRFPVDPSGVAFVGGTIRLKAQNSSPPGTATGAQGKKNLLARAEIVFTFGAQWLDIGKIQAEVGGYIESSAKTGREAMTLMSYLLYRKAVESYVFPQGAINYMWGGRKGLFGAIKSEKWSRDVEKQIIGDNENAYVQAGGIAAIGADGKLGGAKVGMAGSAKLSGGGGTRYDKESIEKVKGVGKLGDKNERSDKAVFSNAQKQLGRGVRFLALEIGGNVGPFNGAASVRLQWEQGAAGYELKAAELEFQAGAKIPNVGGEDFGTRVAGWVTEGVKTLVSKIRAVVGARADKDKVAQGEITKKEQKDARAGSGLGETWGTVLDGLDQLRNNDGIESALTPNPATATTWLGGAAESGPSTFHDAATSNSSRFTESLGNRSMESTIGLMFAIGGDIIGKSMQISINFEKARSFAIPMFLEVSQKSTSRLIAFRLEGGKWSVL
jgi:hypothetical protein